jgi:UDP-2,4-diacetamido-2,4,6-trideoxy-beta-L-altropyranose hydrolase
MSEKLRLCLIRVDASESIGTGHVFRCLALAGELKNLGISFLFLLADCPELLKQRLRDSGFEIALLPSEIEPGSDSDAHYTARLAGENQCSGIVVDGYHFLASYQDILQAAKDILKAAKQKLLYIDDLAHCQHYSADFVLNQNPSASQSLYANCAPGTKLLLGEQYVLLRKEFLDYKIGRGAKPRDIEGSAREILLTMGGSDQGNVTARVIEALALIDAEAPLAVTAVVGAGNKHLEELQKLASRLNEREGRGHKFSTTTNPPDMPALLGKSDLIVSAGGTTVWESAFLARPTAVIVTASNQRAGMECFAKRGAIALLGLQEDLTAGQISKALLPLINDATLRRKLASQSGTSIDGLGARRVAEQFVSASI